MKEEAMQPYEVRQFGDGSIDYNNYYARPVTLLTPAMRRFCREAMAVRRHGDGSIDFDFYRGRSAMLRAQTMREALLPTRAPKAALVAVAAAIVMFVAVAMTTHWI
jgi:hypothetical protein